MFNCFWRFVIWEINSAFCWEICDCNCSIGVGCDCSTGSSIASRIASISTSITSEQFVQVIEFLLGT